MTTLNGAMDDLPIRSTGDFSQTLKEEVASLGGEWLEEAPNAIGRTMFDLPNSSDDSLTILLPDKNREFVPSQALLRIKSQDGRVYIGVVVAGPFAEPDGLRGDTNLVVTTTVRGGIFMPPYHCRCQVELLGEEVKDRLLPPRFRPLPNSPVFSLTAGETEAVLNAGGAIRLGLAAGHDRIEVGIPADKKSVLPRHTGIFGTTGGGKSTTVASLIAEAQRNDFAVIVLDVEGEYTRLNEATTDPVMLVGLGERGLQPHGVANTSVYHLVGRDTANPDHPDLNTFRLRFSTLSPYALTELAEFSEAQDTRFWKAYNLTKTLLRRLGIFPRQESLGKDEEALLNLDEFEVGYPLMTLNHLYDVVMACSAAVDKADLPNPVSADFKNERAREVIKQLIGEQGTTLEKSVTSWRALQGKLSRLRRPNVFDNPEAKSLNYTRLITPGHVSLIDLSDTNSPVINNLVISDILRGVQNRQDDFYQEFEKGSRATLPKVMLIIEEAHEFLSEERISAMPFLFEQVARIAKRGRKRWLSLVFVTQLPQHLPRQLFGLINNYILHKINDEQTLGRLQKVISGVDESLWKRMPGLAPGQAVVSLTSMTRPLLTSIDPAPCKLRMID
jgi:DNA helicase HerA-like ATPase